MSEKQVFNRFRELLAAKARREGKGKISLSQVIADTKLPPDTVYGWANNTITQYNKATLNTLCEYLGVEPGDLLVREEVLEAEDEDERLVTA